MRDVRSFCLDSSHMLLAKYLNSILTIIIVINREDFNPDEEWVAIRLIITQLYGLWPVFSRFSWMSATSGQVCITYFIIDIHNEAYEATPGENVS